MTWRTGKKKPNCQFNGQHPTVIISCVPTSARQRCHTTDDRFSRRPFCACTPLASSVQVLVHVPPSARTLDPDGVRWPVKTPGTMAETRPGLAYNPSHTGARMEGGLRSVLGRTGSLNIKLDGLTGAGCWKDRLIERNSTVNYLNNWFIVEVVYWAITKNTQKKGQTFAGSSCSNVRMSALYHWKVFTCLGVGQDKPFLRIAQELVTIFLTFLRIHEKTGRSVRGPVGTKRAANSKDSQRCSSYRLLPKACASTENLYSAPALHNGHFLVYYGIAVRLLLHSVYFMAFFFNVLSL